VAAAHCACHSRACAGFDPLPLRADMGPASRELADWWTKVREVSQTDRDRMADALAATASGGGGVVWRASRLASKSRRTRARTRGLMNAAAEVALTTVRWLPAYIGGQQPADPEAQVGRAILAPAVFPAQPPHRRLPLYRTRPLGGGFSRRSQRGSGPAESTPEELLDQLRRLERELAASRHASASPRSSISTCSLSVRGALPKRHAAARRNSDAGFVLIHCRCRRISTSRTWEESRRCATKCRQPGDRATVSTPETET
jgi:hypothetical protein